jgi:DNA-nicking Smr family endonuclease
METVNQDTQQVQEEPRTFTQEELDRIGGERLQRERAKYADFEALKEKASKFDQIEEQSKSELQKVTERADALQKELDGMKKADAIRLVRESVAQETGVPVNLLHGETKEECEEMAKAILSYAKPSGYPQVRDGGEVRNTTGGSTREKFKEWFDSNINH